jgi:acetyl-CoA carboxylase carboxyl transferase subunit alpha
MMMENTWYSVISPESCSSILWRTWEFKEKAADALKLTANDMFKNKLIDGIISEPLGGAHENPAEAFMIMKTEIDKMITELSVINTDDLIKTRIEKFSGMGSFTE